MTEQEYKNHIYEKAKKVRTKKDLDELLKEVIEYKGMGYGEIVYAISGCMKAVANYIDRSEVGGITGFQAGFIGWEMVKEFLVYDNKCGLRLMDYDNLLYPQFSHRFDKTIDMETWIRIQNEAKKLLNEEINAHPDVIKHWQSIVEGNIPFGFSIKLED